jgi:hypothetical protein
LPANVSDMVQSMAASGGGRPGNVSYSPSIDARGSQMTAAQFTSLLRANHGEFSGMMSNAYRNGWRP